MAAEPVHAFDTLFAAPRQAVFVRRFAAFPPISEVKDQDGQWDTVGQTRTLVLGDGGTMHETLVAIDRPRSFGYVLDDFHGRLRPFVRSVEGTWTVTPEGVGCRVTWVWTMHPAGPPGRLTMNVIAKMWRGYAERALESVEAILTA